MRIIFLFCLLLAGTLRAAMFPFSFWHAEMGMPYEQYLLTNYSQGLVSYWMLGSNALDSVGTNHGVAVGSAPTYGQAGISGSGAGAALFTSGHGLRCEPRPAPYRPPLGASNWTVAAWVNRIGAGTVINSGSKGYANIEPIVCKGMAQAEGSTLDANYMLGMRSYSNAIRLCVDLEEGTNSGNVIGLNHPATAHTPITNDVWHLVAMTYDQTNWALYVDTIVQANFGTNTFVVTNRAESASQQPFCIGGAETSTSDTWNGAWNGYICHVALWRDRILNSNEIADLYRHGSPSDPPNPPLPAFTFNAPDDGSLTNGSVAVLGDRSGSYAASRGTNVDNAMLANTNIVDVVSVGDLAETGLTFESINDRLLTNIQARGGDIYPAAGNHDYDSTNEVHFPVYFTGVATNNNAAKFYYSVKVGPWMEVFYLDDNSENADNAGGITAASVAAFMGSAMGQWITNAILTSTSAWKIVVTHHPAYSDSASSSGYASLRWPWLSLGVPVVVQGHVHGIERIYNDGLYFCTWAMGGGPHHNWNSIQGFTEFRVESTSTSGYGVFIASATNLAVEYYDTSGTRLDRVLVRKNF